MGISNSPLGQAIAVYPMGRDNRKFRWLIRSLTGPIGTDRLYISLFWASSASDACCVGTLAA